MAAKFSSILGGLFGGKGAEGHSPTRGEGIDYKGYKIHPASRKDGSQWRTEGVIAKAFEDDVKEHHFIRADVHASKEDADACAITKGQRIIEYIGPKVAKAKKREDLERDNPYLFTLDEDYEIDGSVMWNPARFLNHSCVPNCEAVMVRGRIWIYARRRIVAGEELTYNYG